MAQIFQYGTRIIIYLQWFGKHFCNSDYLTNYKKKYFLAVLRAIAVNLEDCVCVRRNLCLERRGTRNAKN